MRVLVITNLYPSEAAPAKGTFVKEQVEGLRRVGVDVDVHYVDRVGGGRRVYRTLRDSIRRTVTANRPDVLHVMYGGVMADVVTRAVSDVPVVVTFYGSDLLAARAKTRGLRRLSALYGVWASHWAARRATAVIVQSQVLANALPERIDPSRITVIPDGVDFRVFYPQARLKCQRRLGWEPTEGHILFPAHRTRPEKQYGLARAAIELLERSGKGVELHELVGVGHDEVPTWLNASDLVVLTSTHEGSPNVVKEALACDVAVVSVDVGDVREHINGIDGCFVAERHPSDLAEKMAAVLDRDSRVRTRERVSHLSLERVALRIRGVYESVVALRR